MIVCRTPLRCSFLGGGTDFPDFYNRYTGAVISAAIDKYIYVVVKHRFDHKILLHYTKTEAVDSVEEVQHDVIREAMRMTGVQRGVEITTLADIPSEGTGLGSSSSLAVGLLHALYTLKGMKVSPERLADEACTIEIDILSNGAGKQDQYIAAYGGLRLIIFGPQGIKVFWIARKHRKKLEERFLLFYTGLTRKSTPILKEKQANIDHTKEALKGMSRMVNAGGACLEKGLYGQFGLLIDESWHAKKTLANGVTTPEIDEMYSRGINAGAIGGKICGAGGGGFLLLYCEKEKQHQVRKALEEFKELPFKFEAEGSKIILA